MRIITHCFMWLVLMWKRGSNALTFAIICCSVDYDSFMFGSTFSPNYYKSCLQHWNSCYHWCLLNQPSWETLYVESEELLLYLWEIGNTTPSFIAWSGILSTVCEMYELIHAASQPVRVCLHQLLQQFDMWRPCIISSIFSLMPLGHITWLTCDIWLL